MNNSLEKSGILVGFQKKSVFFTTAVLTTILYFTNLRFSKSKMSKICSVAEKENLTP